jgi:hypothetical protein
MTGDIDAEQFVHVDDKALANTHKTMIGERQLVFDYCFDLSQLE